MQYFGTDDLWNSFESTGGIGAYLAYKAFLEIDNDRKKAIEKDIGSLE